MNDHEANATWRTLCYDTRNSFKDVGDARLVLVVSCLVIHLWDPGSNPTGGTLWIRFSVPTWLRVFSPGIILCVFPPTFKTEISSSSSLFVWSVENIYPEPDPEVKQFIVIRLSANRYLYLCILFLWELMTSIICQLNPKCQDKFYCLPLNKNPSYSYQL